MRTPLRWWEFMDHNVPKYVIRSHTWIEGQEVTLQDMQNNKGTERSGYTKIKQACALALENGYGYAWVDTCCIDKTSSAELSEAINSMMSWYERSEICYTYLADVQPGTNIHEPESSFAKIRNDIVDLITQITGIDQTYLSAPPTSTDCRLQSRLHVASIAEKMSWASKHKTTRIEDTAYCLLGIFGINMPLLYGEGTNAFLRLQEEIMKRSDDQTILAWYLPEDAPDESGVLTTSLAAFANCKDFIPCDVGMPTPPFQITNKGLRMKLPVSSDGFKDGRYGLLQCRTKQDPTTMIAIPLDNSRNNLKGPIRTGSRLEATIKFVKSPIGTFFDGVSLASSWYKCTDPMFMYWTRRQEQDYDIDWTREHHFGKTLFVFEITEKGVDRHRPDWRLLNDGELTDLQEVWTQSLHQLSYHARSSARTVVWSLALSPWMFTFVIDSLIWKAFKPLGSMIDHIEKYSKDMHLVQSRYL
ncbi:beta transducin-like protein [Fusarium fujikuroi]|nr:beta transducin-like protein [Fusarium fujikuroi]